MSSSPSTALLVAPQNDFHPGDLLHGSLISLFGLSSLAFQIAMLTGPAANPTPTAFPLKSVELSGALFCASTTMFVLGCCAAKPFEEANSARIRLQNFGSGVSIIGAHGLAASLGWLVGLIGFFILSTAQFKGAAFYMIAISGLCVATGLASLMCAYSPHIFGKRVGEIIKGIPGFPKRPEMGRGA